MKKTNLSRKILLVLLISLSASSISAQNTNQSYEDYIRQMNAKFEAATKEQDKIFNSYRDKFNAEFASYMEKAWKTIQLSNSILMPERKQPKPVQVPRMEKNMPATQLQLPHAEVVLLDNKSAEPKPVEPFKTSMVEPELVLPDLAAEDFVIPENSVIVEESGMQKMEIGDMEVKKMEIKEKEMEITTSGNKPVLMERSKDFVHYVRGKNEYVSFDFYGNTCRIRLPRVREFYLKSSEEKAIAEGWKHLSAENYVDPIIDCVCIRHSLHLCDWAVLQMIQAATEAYFGDSACNEAVLMQMYFMTQMGFQIRIGRQGEHLIPLVAYAEDLYSLPYIDIEGTKFYAVGTSSSEELKVCDYVFPGEQPSSIRMKEMPVTPALASAEKNFTSEKYPSAQAKVAADSNLIAFINNYPQYDWRLMATTALSENLKRQLLPSLKKAIAGKSEIEAANILLDFVQTGFQYKTDEEQFGHEKACFPDEMFYYDYSDCEDRSILFSLLVKELLHLDVVLLDYPSHAATAVRFTEEADGDFMEIEGEKYTICDPTYIGAPAGRSLPDCKDQEAKVSKI